jgi:16S rRNA (cytosine1407-C5)-methyltransferase
MDTPTPLSPEFVRRLHQMVPDTQFETIMASFAVAKPTTLRVNTIKTTVADFKTLFASLGIALMPVEWNDMAFIVRDMPLRELTELDAYKEGKFYVQSLSSMLPPLILDPRPGEHVLDLAAAPGSKTTQIAAMMANTGTIVANDTSRVRLYRLEANLKMQGVTNTTVVNVDGRSLWQDHIEKFDKVLLDAPCSMEGRFRTDDPKSYEDWSLKKVKDLAHLQRWLLRSAVSATKTGGSIVYSTCTLSPEENEEVVDWLLKKEKGHVECEQVTLNRFSFDQPYTKFGDKEYAHGIRKTARIMPSETMEGFYVAKLKKIASTVRTKSLPAR